MTDELTINVTITARPDDTPFTTTDLYEAVRATLHEVFPTDDNWPIVPKVELIWAAGDR